MVAVQSIIEKGKALYEKLVNLKQERQLALEQPETVNNINITSERISRLQKRVQSMNELPDGIDSKMVRGMLKKLNQHKDKKIVQKVLRDYTDGDESKFQDPKFIKTLVNKAGEMSLIDWEFIKPVTVQVTITALLIKL